MTVIDAWAQHPTPELLRQPWLASLQRWTGMSAVEVPLDFTVQAMRSAGVDRALLSAWYAPEGALISNADVAAAVRAHPDLFSGMASADIRDPVAAVRQIRRAIEDEGFVAVRLIQWLWELPVTHALYYPVLTVCAELGVPVGLQVGLTGPLRSSESGRPLHIERIALDFPELKIVCGHIGYPWTAEMIAIATKFPNVYIDTSAYKPKRYPPELVRYLKSNGRQKVLFGSNYPMILPADCVSGVDALELDEATRADFLAGNSQRVFGLG